jgi:hypothetical protein
MQMGTKVLGLALLLCLVTPLTAQSELPSPTDTQTVKQPAPTDFKFNSAYVARTFGSFGSSSSGTINNAAVTANRNVNAFALDKSVLICGQQGFDLGNNGTSAVGWTVCHLSSDAFLSAVRGISQMHGGAFAHTAQGDTAAFYTYLTSFGGNVAQSDEAVTHTVAQTYQLGYYTGNITSGGTAGSNLIVTTLPKCHSTTNGCTAVALYGQRYADGGMLLDQTQIGSAATIATLGTSPTMANAFYYTLASGTVTPSTAWGTIVNGNCSPGGNGQNQAYSSTICQITLGTSPASPGHFVAGKDICLAGPFQEEAAVTAIGGPTGGVQSVTFNTRYAWNHGYTSLVMQGGPCGQGFVRTNSWPNAYQVLGATNSTTLWFSNCVTGNCTGNLGGNLIRPASSSAGNSLTRASGTVTSVSTALDYWPVGSSIVVTGCSAPELDGTFPILTNSYDALNPSMTWAQSGANESGTGCVLSTPPASITFFPMAFITGTNGGVQGQAQLATNTVNWTTGDVVLGAPSSQYQQAGLNIYMGQSTSVSGSNASLGVQVNDAGPSQLIEAYFAKNNPGNGPAVNMFSIEGSYGNIFSMKYRPANNGTILYVGGGEPVSANAKPYFIFRDNHNGAGSFEFNPIVGTFSLGGPLSIGGALTTGFGVSLNGANGMSSLACYAANQYLFSGASYGGPGVQFCNGTRSVPLFKFNATTGAMNFTAGANVNGSAICTAAGNCQLAGTTAPIGGRAITAGTCLSGTVTVAGAAVGHTVGVSATDGTLPNPLIVLSAAVTSANTVTVQLCPISAVTPTAKSYNVTTY